MAKDIQTCTYCGVEKKKKEFYQSYSVLYKHTKKMSICKDCIVDIYNNYMDKYEDSKKAIYYMCRLTDSYYDQGAYDGAKKQSESQNSNIAKIYFQKVNSMPQYKNKTFDNSYSFDIDNQETESNSQDENSKNSVEDMEFVLNNEILKRWRGFKQDEVIDLEMIFDELITVYEHDTPIQINLYRNIAITQMKANKAASQGNMQEYDKLMKTLSTLMNDANIKPVQETGADGKGLQTWGEWIKKIEETEPIPEPRDEFKDVDGIRKYVDKWFVGHLKKIFGIDNNVTEPILEKEGG